MFRITLNGQFVDSTGNIVTMSGIYDCTGITPDGYIHLALSGYAYSVKPFVMFETVEG